jgi:predicted nuclease of restriction endonuclease-like (RecB) superfamily
MSLQMELMQTNYFRWEGEMSELVTVDREYKEWLIDLKKRIKQSQIKASVRVNSAMLELYWSIGADIVEKQSEKKWGSGVITQLSKDIHDEFVETQGFSATNLRSMKRFYLFYKDIIVFQHQVGVNLSSGTIQHQLGVKTDSENEKGFPQILGTIPWRHQVEIIYRCKSIDEAIFYIEKTVEDGWSRSVLLNFMQADLYSAQGKSVNNFSATLPEPQSDLANEMLKDPYKFDFIALTKDYKEKELEDALTTNITKFLLELGQGFSYVGRQIPLVVGDEEFNLDLLFYHLKLRCFVAIELKSGKFNPRDLGQLGFYVSAVNHIHKTEADNPTVGLLVCREKNNVVAQYALESNSQPIGISEYELSKLIPADYQSTLPSIEEIDEKLNDIEK